MKKIVIAVAVLGLAACGSKKNKDTTEGSGSAGSDVATKPEPPKPAGRKIPNSDGLIVDAPAKWVDNGIGGAAGMHIEGDQGGFMLREVSADEAKQKFEQKKDEIGEQMAAPWVTTRKTNDGWELIYVLDKMEMKGDKMVPNGTTFAFDVRRNIADKPYSCSGTGASKEIAEEAVALCKKVAKP